MGVTASVVCKTCQVRAPEMGDFGHVGYPSLEDRERCVGDLASFEYIYRGYAAIELRPVALEACRAFLTAHRRHKVGLFYDGEEYPSDGTAERPSTSFVFEDPDFVTGIYQLNCDACQASFSSARAMRLRMVSRRTLFPARLRRFVERVVEVDPANFYRVFDVLSADADDGLRAFVSAHASHRVTAQTIVEEQWQSPAAPVAGQPPTRILEERRQKFWTPANVMPHPAAVAPPLSLAWVSDRTRAAVDGMLVVDGRIYAASAAGSGIVCVSPDGITLWENTIPGAEVAVDSGLAFHGEHLYVSGFKKTLDERRLSIVDQADGRVLEQVPFPLHSLCDLGQGRVIGKAFVYSEPRERRLALFDLRDPSQPVWSRAADTTGVLDRSFDAFAVASDHVLTTWGGDLVALALNDGAILWRRSLDEFGPAAYGHPSGISVWGNTLVFDRANALLGIDTRTGDLRWQRPGERWKMRTVCDGVAYVVDPGPQPYALPPPPSVLTAVRLDTGEDIVRRANDDQVFRDTPAPLPMFTSLPAVGARHVFIVEGGRIWAFGKDSLAPEWMMRPKDMPGIWSAPVAYGSRLLLKGNEGRLVCFEGHA